MDNVRVKPKRQRKRQSRTEVLSSDSDSDSDRAPATSTTVATTKAAPAPAPAQVTETRKKAVSRRQDVGAHQPVVPEAPVQQEDPNVAAAFKRYYMQRLAGELGEDLNAMRSADDFNDAALPMLLRALEQGTSIFSPEEKRRLVEYS